MCVYGKWKGRDGEGRVLKISRVNTINIADNWVFPSERELGRKGVFTFIRHWRGGVWVNETEGEKYISQITLESLLCFLPCTFAFWGSFLWSTLKRSVSSRMGDVTARINVLIYFFSIYLLSSLLARSPDYAIFILVYTLCSYYIYNAPVDIF